MSKFEFIPELVVGRDYDPSPGQKFMDNFDAIFEAIQNSGDNSLNSSGKVKIKISYKSVYKEDLKFIDKNFEKHLKASRKIGDKFILEQEKVDLILIEDFNTTGITGDPLRNKKQTEDGKENNFYFMNQSFGGNQKLDDARKGGSEGEGIQAFNLNSQISTFFYYSVDSTNNNRPSFFGISYLGSRDVDSSDFAPYAFFGQKIKNDAFKEDTFDAYPVTDEENINQLAKIFKLKRKPNEPGTSIIIPHYKKNGVENKDLLISRIIEIYRVPIFRDQLEIEVDEIIINKSTIKELHKNGLHPKTKKKFNEEQKDLIDEYYNFLNQTEDAKNSEADFVINHTGQSKIEKDMFENFETIINKFNDREFFSVKINFIINRLNKNAKTVRDRTKEFRTYVKFYFKKFPVQFDIIEPLNDFIRKKMSIHKVRYPIQGFSLIDIQDDPAALLTKNAEVANHSNIMAKNPKLDNNYKSYYNTILFLKSFPNNFYYLLTNEENVSDYDITQDLFKTEEDGSAMRKTDDLGDDKKYEDEEEEDSQGELPVTIFKVPDIIVPPIFPKLYYYERYAECKDEKIIYTIIGVKYTEAEIKKKLIDAENYIKETNDVKRSDYKSKEDKLKLLRMDKTVITFKRRILEYKDFLANGCTFYPRRIEIEAAFDGEGFGNKSFRRYCIEDFDFSDDKTFKFKLEKNVTLDSRNENHIRLIAKNESFTFRLTGFDKKNIEDVRWRDRAYSIDE